MKIKMVCFDMDGTIADLYGVDGWLNDLRNENPRPYYEAKPMWDMEALASVLNLLKTCNIEIRVVTWLSKDSTESYKDDVRKAKLAWLKENGFPFDNFHGVRYGATKADSVRRYLADDESAILIDDNDKIRNGWTLGEAINPTTTNLIDYLMGLVE